MKEAFAAGMAWVRSIGVVAAPPIARIALALPFLRSGLTRWDGFMTLSPATTFLFEEQFRLHLFGGTYGLPWPGALATVVAVAEIVLPLLLIVGLGTRLSALGLLLMTGVIQLVVPEGWTNFHLYWAALALAVMALGPGPLALDAVLAAARAPAAGGRQARQGWSHRSDERRIDVPRRSV